MDRSEVLGGRFNLDYQYRSLNLNLGYTRLGLYNPDTESFVDVPRFTYSNEFSANLGLGIPYTNARFNVFGRINDRFISYFPGFENGEEVAKQRSQDGFTMLDASIQTPLLNNRVQLTLGVRNLLDVQQVALNGGGGGAHVGGNAAPIGPGRSFFVRASLRIFDNQAAKFKNADLETQQKEAFRIQSDPRAIASWVESQSNGEQVLQVAQQKGEEWSRPKTVSIGAENWFVNELDAPMVTAFPDNDKNLLAFHLEKIPSRNAYDHHLLISRSKNGGKSWSKPVRPYDSEVPAFYGFGAMTPLDNGRILLSWMDGRDTKVYHEASGKYHPSASGKLSLRTVEVDAKGKLYEPIRLTDDVSPLCPYKIFTWEERPTLVYRDANNDIQIRSYIDQVWTAPKLISKVEWKRKTTAVPTAFAFVKNLAIAWSDCKRQGSEVYVQLRNKKLEVLQAFTIK
ncbi:MAG: hypothetical protein AAF242_20500, partial [Bacteroidota bacterium]